MGENLGDHPKSILKPDPIFTPTPSSLGKGVNPRLEKAVKLRKGRLAPFGDLVEERPARIIVGFARWGADPFGRSRSTWEVNPGAQLLRKGVWPGDHPFGEDPQRGKGVKNLFANEEMPLISSLFPFSGQWAKERPGLRSFLIRGSINCLLEKG